MSSGANVLIAKRLFDSPRTGEDVTPLLHPEIEIRDFDLPDAGIYRGHAGFERYLSGWEAAWEDWEWTLEDVLDAGDRVAMLFLITARTTSGARTERHNGIVLTFESGQVMRLDYYTTQLEAREALSRPSTSG